MQSLGADTTFSYLTAAINRADQGPGEIFCSIVLPNNNNVCSYKHGVLERRGFATIADINAATPDSMANIVLYQATHGRLFSTDLSNGGIAPMLNDSTVTVFGGTVITVKGNRNSTAANIIGYNFMTHNGVVQVTDQLLLP